MSSTNTELSILDRSKLYDKVQRFDYDEFTECMLLYVDKENYQKDKFLCYFCNLYTKWGWLSNFLVIYVFVSMLVIFDRARKDDNLSSETTGMLISLIVVIVLVGLVLIGYFIVKPIFSKLKKEDIFLSKSKVKLLKGFQIGIFIIFLIFLLISFNALDYNERSSGVYVFLLVTSLLASVYVILYYLNKKFPIMRILQEKLPDIKAGDLNLKDALGMSSQPKYFGKLSQANKKLREDIKNKKDCK